MCINATQPTEPRVAIIENQKLLALETQEDDLNRTCGNIYLGTITSIQQSIDAVFVDFGSQRHGFLPFKEIAPKYHQNQQTEDSKISDMVSVGQTVLVQVTREEKANKGAALTTFLSLAGAYLVVMPNNQKNNGISKKADANERVKLKEVLAQLDIPDNLSVIVRTEGINRSKDELAWDLECLIHHWEKVHAAAESANAPALTEGASPKKVTFSKLPHRLNAPLPIDFTLAGIVTSAKPAQSKKAPFEIEVTPDDNFTDRNPELLKVWAPMNLTFPGMMTSVKFSHW